MFENLYINVLQYLKAESVSQIGETSKEEIRS